MGNSEQDQAKIVLIIMCLSIHSYKMRESDYCSQHVYEREQRGTKEHLDEGERGERKSRLNTQHSSGSITSWQIDGETMETVTDFTFLGSKITADGDCSLEISLLLERKAMTNIDSIFKSKRHYFADKGLYSQIYGFSSGHTSV